MDLGSSFAVLPVCALLMCLLGTARCSIDPKCPCPEIPKRNDTEPPAKNCFQIGETFRYTCREPNLRKAGTSNFIKCKQTDNGPEWSPSTISLKCIPDPTRTTQPPPSSSATTDPNTTKTQPPSSTAAGKDAHTDIPRDSTIATTDTAAAAAAGSSPQTTQSASTSASVSAEPDGAGPTSPGLQAPSGRSQAGKEGDVTGTEASHPTPSTLTAASTAGIGFLSVAIVCALIGIGFFCYKRRSMSNAAQHTPDEAVPMTVSSGRGL